MQEEKSRNILERMSTLFGLGAAVLAIGIWVGTIETRLSSIPAGPQGEPGPAGPMGETGPAGTLQFPPGAVVAFARLSCPEGWSYFTNAGGRVIVGAGAHGNRGDDNSNVPIYAVIQGADGTTYATGGEAEVALTVEQMPAHSHSYDVDITRNLYAEPGADVTANPAVRESTMTGESEPHNNMPHYIALYWCTPNEG